MSIGERILELRKSQNISQTALAEAMEVSRQAVSKWETDKASPDTGKLVKLAEYLNTEVEYLATGRHPVYKSPDIHVTLIKKPEKIVEKVIEKPVEHIVERVVEKPVERIVEKPVVRHVVRVKYKYRTNVAQLAAAAFGGLLLGFLIGILF